MPVEFGGLDQGHDHGGALAGLLRPDKKPILSTYAERAHRVFGKQRSGVDALLARGCPELAPAVAGQRSQGVGLRQRLQLARIELGAAREIVDAGEALCAPGLRQALGGSLRQRADQTQAEAHGGVCATV